MPEISNEGKATKIKSAKYDGTSYKNWKEAVTDWIWDQLTSAQFGRQFEDEKLTISLSKIVKKLNKSKRGSNDRPLANGITYYDANGNVFEHEVKRTTISEILTKLVASGLLHEPTRDGYEIRPLTKDTVRALLATRDSLDKLIALRLVMASSIDETKLKRAAELINRQRETMQEIGKMAEWDTASPYESETMKRESMQLRIRYTRQDTAMHVALAEAANLGFLAYPLRTVHRYPSLQYLVDEELAPRVACELIEAVIMEHEQIYLAIINARKHKDADSATTLDIALRKHLEGSVGRWEQMAKATKKQLNLSGFVIGDREPGDERPGIESFIRVKFPSDFEAH